MKRKIIWWIIIVILLGWLIWLGIFFYKKYNHHETSYYYNGQLEKKTDVTWWDGAQFAYRLDGSLNYEIYFSNRLRDIHWTWYYDDWSIAGIYNGVNNSWERLYYYRNWQLMRNEFYRKREIDWESIQYYENGKIQYKYFGVMWKKHWEQLEYYESWQLEKIENYRKWKKHWEQLEYYENWQLKSKELYKNWNKVGEWLYYYENWEIKYSSGSCGIVSMIKGKKLIIGNVGDSRLVIFKNGLLSFSTEDHKPGSEIEKKRIEAAGGKIYQTPSIYPLYQNGKEIETPWRVLPGRLSVSRTFGDIEAKDEKFGGMKGVVVALPDITEIELNDEYNFIVIGCDGIFDVISNEELLECIKIVLKEKKINEVIKDEDIHELCGDFAAMIIKSALAKDSFDNVSCIVIALNLNGLL